MYSYFFVNALTYVIFLLTAISAQEQLFKVGCFKVDDISGFLSVDLSTKDLTASACVSACQEISKRFAGVEDGSVCKCGEYFPSADSDSCDIPCPGNRNETCGGLKYVSVYETLRGALGTPRSLIYIKNSENNLYISWLPPAASLSELKGYKVKVLPLFYFNEQFHPPEKNYKYSSLTQTAILDGLLPGVKYKIELRAFSDKGDGYIASLEAWTKVGKPDKPEIPELISRTPNKMIVELTEIIPTGGPISYYHIVVVDETLPVIIDHDSLYDYHKATKRSLPYYIAAELTPDTFDTLFTVGCGKYYGKYYNSPLKKNKDYHILMGVISTINETKSSYSESDHSQHESSHFDFDRFGNRIHHDHDEVEEEYVGPNNGLIIGLSVTIGLIAFLLLMSMIIYLGLRVYFKRSSRRHSDHQELAVHAHIPNNDDNGYAVGSHYVDDEPPPDYYRLLREKVKIIPYQSINIVGDIGVGKFGDVKKGVSLNNGIEQVNCLIHRIEDSSLGSTDKSEMLKTFDHHIRLGKDKNVVALLGLLEEFNIISIVFEYETSTLKTNLIEGRAVQHYPVYAEKNRRFSTIQESQLLEILSGVAKGMGHLHSIGIPHGQLCCRNVALRDGIQPKITGFGLLHFHNDIYVPDYTRWQAPEVLRSKVRSSKSDLWSFGCLLWEAITLGGTPYSDIRNDEILNKIVRGMRLAQPQYISDELYQNMLMCWQTDPDERPSFQELEVVLQKLASDEITPHVLFSLYPSFNYEPYCPHLEFLD